MDAFDHTKNVFGVILYILAILISLPPHFQLAMWFEHVFAISHCKGFIIHSSRYHSNTDSVSRLKAWYVVGNVVSVAVKGIHFNK